MRIAKAYILEKVVQVGFTFVGMMWVKIFPSALTLPETLPLNVIRYTCYIYSDPKPQRTKNKF